MLFRSRRLRNQIRLFGLNPTIIDKLWRDDEVPFDRVIDVYIKNLRKKLHLDCIITVKGVGYRYEAA